MGLERAHQFFLVLADLGGDGGEHCFLVLSEEGDDVVLDLQLAQIPQDKGLAIVHLALAGHSVSLHLLDLLVYLLKIEISVSLFRCLLAICGVDAVEGEREGYSFFDCLLDLGHCGFEVVHFLKVGVDGVDVLFEIEVLPVSALFDLMRLDHIFDHVVELADSDDAVVVALHPADEILDVLLHLAQNGPQRRLHHHLLCIIDEHAETDLLLETATQQQLFLLLRVGGVVEVELGHRQQDVFEVMLVLLVELARQVVDVVDEEEGDGLQLVKLQHHAYLVDNLKLLLNPYLFLEVHV